MHHRVELIIRPRGFSIIGMLIAMACMVVLASILLTSLNKAVTGQGSQQSGTVRSFEDKMYLYAIYTSMAVSANETKGRYIIPSELSGSREVAQNTTANLFSAMLMNQFTTPKQLISGNEYSGYVEEKYDYDYTAYNPNQSNYWDMSFKADLHQLANVSFAHMPLCGERFEKHWRSTMNATVPLIGNRGPKDGACANSTYACGRDGVWRGHIVFGDGHIEFTEDPLGGPNGLLYVKNGSQMHDNIFMLESGPNGADAILSFTKIMSKNGPELQFD